MRKNKLKKIFLSDKALIAIVSVVIVVAIILAYLLWEKGRQVREMNGDDTSITDTFRWTGATGDGKWSTAGNWDTGKVPDDEADVVFDSGDEESVVDEKFYGEINSLRIEGYGGKISQEAPLSINMDYRQTSGEYGVKRDMEIRGNFVQTDESIFTVYIGDVRITGDLEIGDNFSFDPSGEGAVYMEAGDNWKMLMLDASGRKGYFALKEEDSSIETWSFYNGTNSLMSYISQEKGWTLMPETGEWRWNYLFKGLDRGGERAKDAQNAGISVVESKVTMDRGGGVEEWYNNDFRGIEQGFTIKDKVAGEGSLILSGEVDLSNLSVRKDTEKELMLSWEGYDVIRYGELKTVDARGAELKTKLYFKNIEGDRYSLKISVDDDGAQYPITIDPLVIQPEVISPVLSWTGSIGAMGDATEVAAKAGYGRVVTPAGDVDGDGRQELLVTAMSYSGAETNEGKAYLYKDDGAGNFSGTPIWEYESDVANAYFGYSASTAGDVDGDGLDDVIIGAYGHTSNKGMVYLFLGDPLTGLEDTPVWSIAGERGGDNFGWSVSDAGNVNGDEYDDILVGARYYDIGGIQNSGKVYVFFGKADMGSTPVSSSPSWSYPSEDHESLANNCNELLGWSVSSAGDINLDNIDDIIVAAPQHDGGDASGKGAAYLFLGNAGSGPSLDPEYVFKNDAVKSFFGNPVSRSGFVNNDIYPDLLIGASRYDGAGVTDGGILYVYYGKWDAIKGESYFELTPDWSKPGMKAGAFLGSAWRIAGDVNGDGYDDAIAGACQYTGTYSREGQAMLFMGSAAGMIDGRAWEIIGDSTGAQMGWNASSMGDINGDGASEFTMSAYLYGNDTIGGQAYLYKGENKGITPPAEICYGGADEDGDGDFDMDDDDCVASLNQKSMITVTVSTADRDDWFTDSTNIDVYGDSYKDIRNPDDPDYLKYRYYALCDRELPSYDSQAAKDAVIPNPYICDLEYKPCDRDDVHDDLHNADVTNTLYIQPDSKKFKIRAEAQDNEGVGSIMIEWRNDIKIDSDAEWDDANTQKHICDDFSGGINECNICAVGNTDCKAEDRVIDYASLGIASDETSNRLFFRVTVTDLDNKSTTTGYDDDTTVQPVFDKYFRMHMCSSECHTTCTNEAPEVTLVGATAPANTCGGLNYTLDWDFSDADGDGQSFYELQVRDVATGEILTSVQESVETKATLIDGFLDGSLKHDTQYQWQVRVYDDYPDITCRFSSEWKEWNDADVTAKAFTTPPNVPDPTFDMDIKNTWTTDCGCSFSKMVTFTSTTPIVAPATYEWFIDDVSYGESVDPVGKTFFWTFVDDTDLQHEIRLKVADSRGTCTATKILNLGKRSPTWTEMAPPLE